MSTSRNAVVGLVVSPEVKQKIEETAQELGVSNSTLVYAILAEATQGFTRLDCAATLAKGIAENPVSRGGDMWRVHRERMNQSDK